MLCYVINNNVNLKSLMIIIIMSNKVGCRGEGVVLLLEKQYPLLELVREQVL